MLEEAGVPTVIIAVQAFRRRLEMMSVPRALLTPHLMGRPIGRPGDSERQNQVLRAALRLLETADRGGTIVDFT
jgi:hypothetical protein